MKKENINEISDKMKEIDFCMMTTKDKSGKFQSRPMSNNKDVDYNGDSWFFTFDATDKVQEIEVNPSVSLSFIGKDMVFIHVYGEGEIIRDKAVMEKHWQEDLSIWFKDGLETQGLTLIHVKAMNITYWNKDREEEYDMLNKEAA